MDEKKIVNVQSYLKEASEQCRLVGTEKGEHIIKLLEKLAETLKERIEEIKLETKKQKVDKNGKGIGLKVRYNTSIDNFDINKHLVEISNLLNEIEAPIFKRIAQIEKENLEKLELGKGEKESLPKSSWQHFDFFIKKFWKLILAIGTILATLSGIISNWDTILEFIKNIIWHS